MKTPTASHTWLLLATVSALLLSACSTTTAGSPAPAPSSSTSQSEPAPPYGGAPKVDNPLPDSTLAGDPCDALTPEQLKVDVGPGITGTRGDLSKFARACHWSAPQVGALLVISFMSQHEDGLSPVYSQTQQSMKRFDVLPPIQGFPAVGYSDKPGPVSSFCNVAVGVADNLRFEVSLTVAANSTSDACKIAAEIAGDVATTLKQKAGR
ncbi:DUF3558 domain-containing protein [Amycolatopsis sp. NBC_00345]|uniref:DUF3558 domain-containing protein n=1 Tax=Amycolatopsis sp. NBC_00345 TaxID=2975955 RepID=UPI002E273A58